MGIPFRCKIGHHKWVIREIGKRKIEKCEFCGTGKTEIDIDDIGRSRWESE